MKKNRWKIIRAGLVLAGILTAALLARSAYKIHWRGSLDIEPAETPWPAAETPWPAAETLIDLRNATLSVPAPFELTYLRAEAVWPDDYSLSFEENIYGDRDKARWEMDESVKYLREGAGRSSGRDATVTIHPLGRRLECPAVLAVEYSALRSGRGRLNLHLYMLGDQGYLTLRHYGQVETPETDSHKDAGRELERPARLAGGFLSERERFLERADEFLKGLGRSDFPGRAGGLEALNRLAAGGLVPGEINLYSARFNLPGNRCAQSRFVLWSCDLEIRRAISWTRTKPRNYWSELLFPWLQPDGLRERNRPLEVGGRPGREIIRQEKGSFRDEWWFIWEEDSPPAPRDGFWQIYFSTRDADRVPERLAWWRRMLERARLISANE